MVSESVIVRRLRSASALAGSLACLLVARPANAEPFTLVVMPDTQTEATNTPQVIFPAMTQWIADNQAARNIQFVAHVGDLVNWDTPFSDPPHFQYVNADAAFDTLDAAGILHAIAVGNHDTAAVGGEDEFGNPCYCSGAAAPGDVHANLRNTDTLNEFFPLSRFLAVEGAYEPAKMDNAYHVFSAGGVDWLVISTELDPRPGALEWFNTVVSEHPDHNVVYLTHNYLNGSGDLAGGVGYGDLAPQAVWDGLLRLHRNIRFVLSGHVSTTALRETAGDSGETVYQLLTDYQSEGTGWLRTLEIDPEAGTVSSQIYSPYLDEYRTGPTEEFTLTDVMFIPAAEPVGGAGGAAGGGAAGAAGNGGSEPATGGAAIGGSGGAAGAAAGGSSGSPPTTGATGGSAGSGPGSFAGADDGAAPAGDDEESGGCGCRQAGSRRHASLWSVAALLLAALLGRRRRQ